MLFNSFEFIGFFLLVLSCYWLLPNKFRWILLLIASYLFYMSFNPLYLLLILASTLTNYVLARTLLQHQKLSTRKWGLFLALTFNLGLLAYFKFFDFFIQEFESVLSFFNVSSADLMQEVHVPIGISFYTFQTLAYLIDIYHEKIEAEKHVGKFALFVAFFPQLLAGPIERAQGLLGQFHQRKIRFSFDHLQQGASLFLWGLFKKVVVAENIGVYLNPIYEAQQLPDASHWLLAAYLYPFQLYADFSGYSDMAQGLAKMLGYSLSDNFNKPFLANSITDFWRKWHISLTTWFSDYVFTPLALATRNGGRITLYLAILVTFALSGLWHEASWNFVIWGTLNGVFLCLEQANPIRIKKPSQFLKILQIIFTFHLVGFTFIFLTTDNVSQSFEVIAQLANVDWTHFFSLVLLLKSSSIFVALTLLMGAEILFKKPVLAAVQQYKLPVRFAFHAVLIFALVLLGDESGSPFIYFRF